MPDYSTVIEALKVVDPTKPYGTALFDALARVTVSVAIEAVCLRLQKEIAPGVLCLTSKGFVATDDVQYGVIEVYMIQRSQDDTAYPGEWHCPGSVMRPGESFEDVLDRLAKKEFGADFVSAMFVANINPSSLEPEARGHFLSIVYLCDLEEKEGLRGEWFPVNQLPEKTVEHHRKRIIPAALGTFVADHSNT